MTEGTTDAPLKYLEPTPESGDKYVNADVMLPHGRTLSRVQVIGGNSDADGNPICKSNENTILYSHLYRVDFEDGEVT